MNPGIERWFETVSIDDARWRDGVSIFLTQNLQRYPCNVKQTFFDLLNELAQRCMTFVLGFRPTDGIDILVDLKGHALDARLDVFAMRPAPVQVSWPDCPGTLGASYLDYLIADP